MPVEAIDEARVLVFAPRGRDAALTASALAKYGVSATTCASVDEVCEKITEGAGAAMLTEEAFEPALLEMLEAVLARQPAWSDFPFILFGNAERAVYPALDNAVRALGNVTVLERPVRLRAMIAAVKTALRARSHQYEARTAIRSRDQFLAMLGHELRNPLAAIRMAVDLAGRHEGVVESLARQHTLIDRQSRHLTRLVDDLLDVARVTCGKINLERAAVDVSDVIRVVVQAYEHLARVSGVELAHELGDDLVVEGDRVRIEQTFGNVVANALKYTPRGGSVRVEAFRNDTEVTVRVSDTGVGINEETLPLIFDLFTQADHSLDRAQGGMGLGLTLVKGLVQLHGGSVIAESGGAGKGSVFTIRLPRATGSSAAPIDAPPSTPAVAGKRVVVVDDSDDLRASVKEWLERAGFEVTTADSGPEAVTQIARVRPDIAFIDIGLPGYDGYEVAKRVRADPGLAVVLVALTGYGQNDDRQRALESGFDRHMTKPVSGRELVAAAARAGR
jgi:signal transduction histidine kinase